MITERDLQEAISECEGQRNPTSNTCLKLAAFYTIKDKLYPEDNAPPVDNRSFAVAPRVQYSYDDGTEFGRLVESVGVDKVLTVMGELMDTLAIVNPRLHDGVIRKLNN